MGIKNVLLYGGLETFSDNKTRILKSSFAVSSQHGQVVWWAWPQQMSAVHLTLKNVPFLSPTCVAKAS